MIRDAWQPVAPAGVPAGEGVDTARQDAPVGPVGEDAVVEGRRPTGLTFSGKAPSGVQVLQVAARRITCTGVEADAWRLVDVDARGVDVAGANLDRFSVRRAAFEESRFRALAAPKASLVDVAVERCTADGLWLRFARLQRVAFHECTLAGADFGGARLDRVTFDRCDLTGARFDDVEVVAMRFRGCTLEGVRGALSLRGASLGPADLVSLAPALAAEAGLTVTDEPP